MDQLDLANRFDHERRRLRAVAYRILGSLSEADDAVQEAWLRLQRSDASEIENLEGWLTTVVARICLNMLRGREHRAEQPLDGLHPEPLISRSGGEDPEYEAMLADAVGIALQVVLCALAPAERLAFVLHDMFAVPFEEIAALVDRSPAATRQLASRARRRVRDAAPPPDPDIDSQRTAVDAYLAAARDGDIEALIEVLDPEVVLRAHRRGQMIELRGPSQVSRGAAAGRRLAGMAEVEPVLVNGSAGTVAIVDGKPFAVLAFSVRGGRILTIDVYNDQELLPRLPGLGLR
jgi:RNA polymerase sigma-70 factor (ECF subfamily)